VESGRRTAAIVFAGFCAFVTLYAPQPLLPMLAGEFRVSAARASLLVTASTLAVAIAAPFAGAIADRYGRKGVIVPAALLLAIPTALAATAANLDQLLFWRFWQGVFTPGIFAVTIAYINEEWERGAGSAMSAYVSGTILGGYSGRMISAFVAAAFGWRWSFLVLAALAAAGACAMWAWLPPGRKFQRAAHTRSMARAMFRHLRNPRLAATYAIGFCVLFTLIASFTYVNFYLAAPPFSLSTSALGLLFTVYLVGAAVTPLAGRSIDRLGSRFTLVVAFTGGIAGIALTLAPHLSAVLAGLALCSTAVFVAQAAASSFIGTVAREARAAAVGLYVMFYYAGGSLGGALPGLFWSRGGWPACAACIGVVQALTIAIGLIFWRPARKLSAAM
jgi:predicted MFS family arabinose efflux permease